MSVKALPGDVCEYWLLSLPRRSFPERPRVHANGSAIAIVGAVVVFPGAFDSSTLAVRVVWQETLAHGSAALEGEAQLASVAEAVDNIVAVDGALHIDISGQYIMSQSSSGAIKTRLT